MKEFGTTDRTSPNDSKLRTVSIFPNPTSGILTISTGEEQQGRVLLLDLNGQIILEQAISPSLQFDLSELPNGMYWMYVRFEDGASRREKILKL